MTDDESLIDRQIAAAYERGRDVVADDVLTNAPESWDGEESAVWIAGEYVRELQRRVLALGGTLKKHAKPDGRPCTDDDPCDGCAPR